MKKLHLIINEGNITLHLCEGDSIVDYIEWVDDRDLLEKFFVQCDLLLKRQEMDISHIGDFSHDLDSSLGVTSERIATTIMKSLSFARTQN